MIMVKMKWPMVILVLLIMWMMISMKSCPSFQRMSLTFGKDRNGMLLASFSSIYGLLLIACGIAVATCNEGSTDFKETPAYKESVQSGELLEVEPDASNFDVFGSNPTEVAPSLD